MGVRRSPLAAAPLVIALVMGGARCGTSPSGSGSARGDTVVVDDFESNDLNAWVDEVDPARHRIVTDSAAAQSGRRYLEVTYLAGGDGGWLTRFFMPGYDSLYVSYYVRFPTGWQGDTKLIALYGSRTDDQWSALGKAGTCPSGSDFFATMLVALGTENPGPMRFYTYYPAMAREPDGVTCWGRFGDGTETYAASLGLSPDVWHHVELWVKLNAPDQTNVVQTFWLDGVQRGSWSGISLRRTKDLRLNALQLSFNRGTAGGVLAQRLHVDHLTVTTVQPAR